MDTSQLVAWKQVEVLSESSTRHCWLDSFFTRSWKTRKFVLMKLGIWKKIKRKECLIIGKWEKKLKELVNDQIMPLWALKYVACNTENPFMEEVFQCLGKICRYPLQISRSRAPVCFKRTKPFLMLIWQVEREINLNSTWNHLIMVRKHQFSLCQRPEKGNTWGPVGWWLFFPWAKKISG